MLHVIHDPTRDRVTFKNILVQYQGGSYVGCFWEWNFFAFDKDGKFRNLVRSGIKGIKTHEQAIAVIDPTSKDHNDFYSDVRIYDLTNKEDVERFQGKENSSLVLGIVQSLNSGKYGEYDGEIFFRCTKCNKEVDMTERFCVDGEEFHRFSDDKQLCDVCYDDTHCQYCGEYDDECDKQEGLCNYHWEKKQKIVLQHAANGSNFKQLVYDPMTNRFTEEDPESLDFTCFLVRVDLRGEFSYRYYIVDACTEKEAMNDCDVYFNHKALLKAWPLKTGLEKLDLWDSNYPSEKELEYV